jgi:hypothetical protein
MACTTSLAPGLGWQGALLVARDRRVNGLRRKLRVPIQGQTGARLPRRQAAPREDVGRDAGQNPSFDSRLVQTGRHLLFFSGNDHIWATDATGKLAWSYKAPESWTIAPRVFANSIAYLSSKKLEVLGLDGQHRASFESAAGQPSDFWVGGDRAWLLAVPNLLAVDLAKGIAHPLMEQPVTSMAHLVGVADGALIVQVYLNGEKPGDPYGYFLLSLPGF